MNSKKHIQWLSLLIVFLVTFGFGQSAWAATWYSQDAVTLNNPANWNSAPDGSGSNLGAWVNTDKYVVQGTHVLTFAAATFDTLFVQSTGNHITAGVTVNGVVSVEASCSPTAGGDLVINGTLIVSNGAALTPAGNIKCNDLIISDATMTVATLTTLNLVGDLYVIGTSALTAGDGAAVVTMTGTTTQTITVDEDSYCEFGDLTINGAGVETSSNITMRDVLTTTDGAFSASAGTVTFNPLSASVLWDAIDPITLNDVVINLGFNGAPTTGITINGDFTKIGGSDFAPTDGTVTFTNSNLAGKNLQLVGGTNSFVNLVISAGSKITTTSDFTIGDPNTAATDGSLTVGSSASLICEAGTVTIYSDQTTITNNGTLEFNNLTNDANATVGTSIATDFTIKGDLTNANGGLFLATAGTITFKNATQKTITNSNNAEDEFVLWGLTIAEGSDVTCGQNITIKSDLTLEALSELTFTAGAVHLDEVDATINIIVADDANLEFYDVIIGATEAAVVNTADSFTVNGIAFTVTDANDFFSATAGTVNFTNKCVLTNATDGNLIFNNITIDGADADVTDAGTPDFIQIKGNLTINGVGSTFANGGGSTTTFIGTSNSTIGGNTDQDPAATFDVLVINKTGTSGNDKVNLEVNVAIADAPTSTITLTDGVLDLGSTTLTVGANVLPTQTSGAINGATGTYVISTGHVDGLVDAFFTIDGTPTLYNLDVSVDHAMGAGNLTVNNDFDFKGAVDFTIPANRTLEVKGDLLTTAAGTFEAGNVATSVLKLSGTGTCDDLSDNLFGTVYPSITIERAETLAGDLTLQDNNVLTINTSTNYLDLNGHKLDLNAGNGIVLNRISGGIDASASGSGVFLNTHSSQTTIPANLFKDNIVEDLEITGATTLGGDLTLNGTFTQTGGPFMITTNNNTLTLGSNIVFVPAFNQTAYVIGNLKRTVTNSATLFPVGNGTATTGYSPLTLRFETAGSSQVVKVSSQKINPVYGRGGDATRAVNALWTITPTGTAPSDNMLVIAAWGTDYDNGLAADFSSTKTFLAKWNDASWTDYRDATKVYAVGPPKSLTPSTYDINASSLSGNWAIFSAALDTEDSKDAAIDVTKNKLVIKNINPLPVQAGIPFTATVEIQDQYGNATPVTGTNALTLAFAAVVGSGAGITPVVGVIPVGSSSVTISGFSYAAAGVGNQFKVTGTGMTTNPNVGLSPLINVIGGLPSNQVNTIVLGGGTTSTTLSFSLTADNGIIIAKAGSAITSNDFPQDGVTYFASSNFGEGSKIGDAVVVYKGLAAGTPITINGLAPNTTYYFRGFSYGAATAGTEKYLTFASALNPVNFTTGGNANNDDDIDYGTNNTMATAKPIGSNSPIKGTIKSATDEDWFSFTITNSASNLRARLTLSAALGNYNIELYNADGRRLRRGTRLTNNNENQVINELEPGTYLVRVLGVDGAFDATNYYTLQLTTDGNEIYSVTE